MNNFFDLVLDIKLFYQYFDVNLELRYEKLSSNHCVLGEDLGQYDCNFGLFLAYIPVVVVVVTISVCPVNVTKPCDTNLAHVKINRLNSEKEHY